MYVYMYNEDAGLVVHFCYALCTQLLLKVEWCGIVDVPYKAALYTIQWMIYCYYKLRHHWGKFWTTIHLSTYGIDSETHFYSERKLLSYGELTFVGEKFLD